MSALHVYTLLVVIAVLLLHWYHGRTQGYDDRTLLFAAVSLGLLVVA